MVLHALRLKGFAEPEAIADRVGLDVDDVVKRLETFEDEGLVRYRGGAVSGWTLTAAGRREDERRAASELDASGARAAVEAAYRTFLSHNADVLQLCTAWQLRDRDGEPVLNDHSEPEYDAQIVDRLLAVDAAIQPVLDDLASRLDRYSSYGPRLASAAARVAGDEKDWFTKPTIDSYHTIWFELHEDFLATLGIERGKETG